MMFEKFSSQSRSDWIEKANQEVARIEAVSFPYHFTMDELSLEAINTQPDSSPPLVRKYALPKTDEKPLISVWIPESSELQQIRWIESAVKQGAEDIYIPTPFRWTDELKTACTSESSLRSFTFVCDPEESEALLSSLGSFIDEEKLRISLYSNVLSKILKSNAETVDFTELVSLVEVLRKYPRIRCLGIGGSAFGEAGALVSQELAYTLSWLVSCWDYFSDQGFEIEALTRCTEISLSIGNDFYTDMIKFRAMRILLYYLMDAYQMADPNPYRVPLRAVTSTVNKTLYDPDSNLLRNTTEGLAATLGGAQLITLRSHDMHYRIKSVFGQRMALNLQHLLRYEAHLHQVHNPIEGSYFLERATSQLVEKAWQLFLTVEQEGGIQEWLERGELQALLRSNLDEKRRALATQQKTLVGVSRYTNPTQRISQDQVDLTTFGNAWSAALEQLRLRSDRLSESEKVVFLLITPASSKRTAQITQRLNYAGDLFASVGVSLQRQEISYPEEALQDIQYTLVRGVVICADDDWYEERLEPVLQAIPSSKVVKMAVGNPTLLSSAQTDNGLDVLLHPKADLADFYGIIDRLLPTP